GEDDGKTPPAGVREADDAGPVRVDDAGPVRVDSTVNARPATQPMAASTTTRTPKVPATRQSLGTGDGRATRRITPPPGVRGRRGPVPAAAADVGREGDRGGDDERGGEGERGAEGDRGEAGISSGH